MLTGTRGKPPGACAVCVALWPLLAGCLGLATVHFRPLPAQPQTPLTLLGSVRSLVVCGGVCAAMSGCRAFCKAASSSLCYGHLPASTLPQETDSDTPGLTCYVLAGVPTCPSTYSWVEGQCVKAYMDLINFAQAQTRCAADGGHVYYYKTLAQDEPVITALLQTVANEQLYSGYWLGGEDELADGTYLWGDGSPIVVGDNLWSSGEPNLAYEKCINIWSYDRRINDILCSKNLHTICQVDIFG